MPSMEYNGKTFAGASDTCRLFTLQYWPFCSRPSYFHVRASGVTAKTPSSSRWFARQARQFPVKEGQIGHAGTGRKTCLQPCSLTRIASGTSPRQALPAGFPALRFFPCAGGPQHHWLSTIPPRRLLLRLEQRKECPRSSSGAPPCQRGADRVPAVFSFSSSC